jgi:ABC transporter substrate binding protein
MPAGPPNVRELGSTGTSRPTAKSTRLTQCGICRAACIETSARCFDGRNSKESADGAPGTNNSCSRSGSPVVASSARAAEVAAKIGFLSSGSPEAYARYVASFREGLSAAGYAAGRDVAIEYRWARGQNDKLALLAADLVKARVRVIAGVNSTPAVRAANAETSTIPIIFTIGADPVKVGLVKSLNHPEANVTGVSFPVV